MVVRCVRSGVAGCILLGRTGDWRERGGGGGAACRATQSFFFSAGRTASQSAVSRAQSARLPDHRSGRPSLHPMVDASDIDGLLARAAVSSKNGAARIG